MKTKKILLTISVVLTQHIMQGAILRIENNTKFTCEVQPVVDKKDLSTMGPFKYIIKPNMSVSYNSGIYPIVALRWRINIYSGNNTQLTRHYYLAEIPKIGITNISAAIKILSNGLFQYYENKSNSGHYIENQAKYLKYIYLYDKQGQWNPLTGIVGNTTFLFNQELSNDIYR